ncbi:Trans-resveratrol di-O-methyltransferase [Hibiscus syriacus]|uniref:Trans-resveratrol di-O-methyltransferase n=1 Tax=Hibiscus syriacus TaxID=106335 RepID=A0A6A3BPB5_HIBSY|nr:Trans-resveratrol di-O-methyltransferase [Hibiscus syriacus]
MDMANGSEENVNELLGAHAHVWNHLFSFIRSMPLKCTIDLGIPDIIQDHGKPMTVTELVVALPTLDPTKACNIYRLMRVLVHLGFFARQKLGDDRPEDGYVLTNAFRLLLNDHPLSVTPLFKVVLDPILIWNWHFLGAWFQNNDRSSFETAHGKTFWNYCRHDPHVNDLFNEAMSSDSRLADSVLIGRCKGVFEGLNSLVDVGGDTGTLGKAISDAFPHLKYTVFDLPHVLTGLQDSGNLRYVGGDMFEEVPAADAVLLKLILHDWNHDECLKILKQCNEAISNRGEQRGKVIIIDMVLRR